MRVCLVLALAVCAEALVSPSRVSARRVAPVLAAFEPGTTKTDEAVTVVGSHNRRTQRDRKCEQETLLINYVFPCGVRAVEIPPRKHVSCEAREMRARALDRILRAHHSCLLEPAVVRL